MPTSKILTEMTYNYSLKIYWKHFLKYLGYNISKHRQTDFKNCKLISEQKAYPSSG